MNGRDAQKRAFMKQAATRHFNRYRLRYCGDPQVSTSGRGGSRPYEGSEAAKECAEPSGRPIVLATRSADCTSADGSVPIEIGIGEAARFTRRLLRQPLAPSLQLLLCY
jgi:hypothetical protein